LGLLILRELLVLYHHSLSRILSGLTVALTYFYYINIFCSILTEKASRQTSGKGISSYPKIWGAKAWRLGPQQRLHGCLLWRLLRLKLCRFCLSTSIASARQNSSWSIPLRT